MLVREKVKWIDKEGKEQEEVYDHNPATGERVKVKEEARPRGFKSHAARKK